MTCEPEPDVGRLAEDLLCRHPAPYALALRVGTCTLQVTTNSPVLHARLQAYFRNFLDSGAGASDFHVVALQAPEPDFAARYLEWPRDPGKTGRKDTYRDLPGGRLVRKVRTGMQFILRPDQAIAVGACEQNLNQVINLINSQYLSWMVCRGYLVCHAAAVIAGRAGLGLSGVSGAGKSTLALRLVSRGLSYVSNDRLLVGRDDGGLCMAGVPKMPRINPGTILGNRDLWPLLSDARRAELLAMPQHALWDIEDKYDADIEQLYGQGRVLAGGPLRAFAVLCWDPAVDAPPEVWRGRLRQRPDLLPAITKHPGVFHTDARRGQSPPPTGPPEPAPYLELMGDLTVLAFSGGVDFAYAADACQALLAEGHDD